LVDAGSLLAKDGDEEFIESAYGELFGRLPDANGYLNYRFLLRAGVPRTAVLDLLVHSAEGRCKRVVLENVPPAARMGLIGRAAFFVKLQLRMLMWKTFERSGELAERRYIAGAARYWHLVSASLTAHMRRQQELETAIHVWRRETDARFRRLEAALEEAAARAGASGFDKTAHGQSSRAPNCPIEAMLHPAAGSVTSLLWELSPEDGQTAPIEAIQRVVDAGYRVWRVCPESGERTPFSASSASGLRLLLFEKAEPGEKPE
jgi:hypothetical protein